ncbi:MAG: oligosaccharide flippase family protein, partial [Mucinivorans sp.]
NQLKAGAVLNYVVLGLNTAVGLAYTPYMLRMLGQSEYGLYALAASVIAYLTILDCGFGNAIIRYTAKYRAEGKTEEQYTLFGLFTALYTVIGVLTLAAGAVLFFNVDSIFGDTLTVLELERARTILLLMILNLAVTFPLSIYGAIITAYEDFIFLRVVSIVRILLNTVVMICLLSMGYKALAMVVVQTVFNMATLLLNYLYCKHKIHIRIKFRRVEWGFFREVAIYSFWIFLNAIMDRIYWSTGQFVLGATVGTIAVAVFAVAIQLQAIYMSFSGAVSSVFLPRITAMVASKCSPQTMSELFIRVGRVQYIVLAFILSGFIVFGQQFINLWAGADYSDSYIITLLFFVPLTVPLIQNLGITILQARNQMKFRSLLYIFIALGSLALQIPLAKHYGGVGCAIAIAGALTLGQVFIMNIYYQRVQRIDIYAFWREIAKMSIVPLVLCSATFVATHYIEFNTISRLAGGIFIFSLIYLPLFWRFGMNQYERELLWSPIKKLITH